MTHSSQAINAATPVLEIGGTHVTAALVARDGAGQRVDRMRRRPLSASGSAEQILASLVRAAGELGAPERATWGVAIPGPFDYQRGIGEYHDVGKFDALAGVDVRDRLLAEIRPAAAGIVFVNDADAFTIGEWTAGAARGHDRVLGLTLGTGIGSCFLDRGHPVHSGPTVPPGGYAHLLSIADRPLEETVSRRAVLAYHRRLAPDAPSDVDVDDLAKQAGNGDQAARRALTDPFAALGAALAPWVASFRASVVTVGGAMSRSWDLVGPPLSAAIRALPATAGVTVTAAGEPEHAALLGAAHAASHRD
ncbi:MAG: ROK family protein [Micromonosporaceae bacterium]|nr:ROK family protein [Micromonosporaceae bacterium]